MKSFRIHPQPLKGRIHAQPSKSMAHRAIICASLAQGESFIENVVLSDDMTATIGAVRALGTKVDILDSVIYPGRKRLHIRSTGKVTMVHNIVDCHESGSTARFIMPITRLIPDKMILIGRGRLIERPFELYQQLFTQKGVQYKDEKGKMPITMSGTLQPGEYVLPGDISSQFISGLLFALPLLSGDSKIMVTNNIESVPYIQMTLQSLKEFGIDIQYDNDYRIYHIKGNQSYKPNPNYVVEGDWSQAAFFCIMSALSGDIAIDGLNTESLQGDKVITEILAKMGAKPRLEGGSLTFEKSSLHGIDVDVSQCPDLVPAIAVAASVAEGKTRILNAARLRMKESDRLSAVSHELGCLGAKITEEPDGLIIEGVKELAGGKANGSGDHRIVMALAAASVISSDDVEIDNSDAVSKSYPEFWDDFKTLGGMEVLL